MEGLLKKKNSQGVWKDRYCQLRNSFLMTFKPLPDKSGPSDELKETIDLKKLAKITVTVADILEITLSTGDFFQYKGASLDVWIDLITKRSTWALLNANAFSSPKTPFGAALPYIMHSLSKTKILNPHHYHRIDTSAYTLQADVLP